eukprot:8508017-Heterocapsa_arctica.AAC.1
MCDQAVREGAQEDKDRIFELLRTTLGLGGNTAGSHTRKYMGSPAIRGTAGEEEYIMSQCDPSN